MYVCDVHACLRAASVEAEALSRESWDHTQAVRLGDRCFYSLSQPTSVNRLIFQKTH